MVEPLVNAGVNARNIDVFEPGKWYSYGSFDICPEKIPHNVPNCGYRIFMGGEKIFYATDCYTLNTIEAKEYDYYLVESNFREEEMKERIERKLENGEFAYELQARFNHQSEERAIEWLAKNAGPNSKYLWLHQHKQVE